MNKFKKEQFIKQRYSEKSNQWSFQVRLNGDKVCKTFSEKDYGSPRRAYDQAIIYRNQAMVDLNNGIAYCTQDRTLDEVFNDMFSLFPMREETKRKHIINYNRYIKDDILIKNVSRAYIMSNLNSMVKDCSDDTIKRVFSLWRKIFKSAIINEYVINDPTNAIVPPKSQKLVQKHKEVVCTRETLDNVETAVSKHMPKESNVINMALEIMWYCGLRPCEVFALNKSDIKNGYINIDKELGSGMSYCNDIDIYNINVIRKCKTKASIRKVPIPTKLQELLDNYKCDTAILLPNLSGDYYSVSSLGTRLKALGYDFNMYQLRHTLATRLVTSGIDQRTIIEILGHEKIDMSVYYARSNQDLKKTALEVI